MGILKSLEKNPLILRSLVAIVFPFALLAGCRDSGDAPSPHNALHECIEKVPFQTLLQAAAPQSFKDSASGLLDTKTSILFQGRQRWHQELSPYPEILTADASNFQSFCKNLEKSLRSNCQNVSSASVGETEPPRQTPIAASCTVFLTQDDQAGVLSAFLQPQGSGNSRLVILAYGW